MAPLRLRRPRRLILAAGLAAALLPGVRDAAAQAPLVLFGAGSLRETMGEVAATYARDAGVEVRTAFGFSGLMRERIEHGERADLFASADMGHPERLLREGRAVRVVMFTRNALCVVAAPGTDLSPATLLDRLLDPGLPLGVFPALRDPIGDYTLALFRRIEAHRPGAGAALRTRATVVSEAMVGRPLAPGEDWAVALLRDGVVRLRISYCSTMRNRLLRQVPGLEVAHLAPELRVGPEYGFAVLRGAAHEAADLALFILSPQGQRILATHGFAPIVLPEADPR